MSTEILGLTEILGEDYDVLLGDDDGELSDEEIGAAVRRGRAAPKRAAAPRPAASGGTRVATKEMTRARELVLGFDSGAVPIPALGQATVNSNPQQVFRPERISIPATIAPNFLLNSITIGTAIQFLNATGVHAEIFGTTSSDVRLRMDTAQINSVVSFNVQNLSAVAQRFFGALIGPAVM